MMSTFTARNVALTDQILATLADEYCTAPAGECENPE